MISATDLKPGVIYLDGDALLRVMEYKRQKIARGGGSVVLKVKDLIGGSIVKKTYTTSRKVEDVRLETVEAEYLYKQQGEYFFMDVKTYEQFEVKSDHVSGSERFLKEGLNVKIRIYRGKVVDIELPIKVDYKVVDAPPDIRGNTAQGGTKEVELEGGGKVSVPMFIKKNDKVVVDTRTGKYVERAG